MFSFKTRNTPDTEVWWLPLGPESSPDQSLLGGKGANLVRLVRAGFEVPPGAVLTTELFRDFYFLEEAAIQRIIDRVVEDQSRPDRLWAVRSSAADEDGLQASFAGQYDTFLNVPDSNLLNCVKKCRDSVFSSHAERYRSELAPGQSPSMAVVLQTMVPARCAGVLFTRHPVRPDVDRIVVEGVPGLGEDLVSGRRNPDHLELSRNGQRLLEASVDGTNCLDQVGDEAFARLARELEKTFGKPQDAEWAFDGETLWVLQTRPITTLKRPAKVWTRAWGDEFWAEATTELQYTRLGRWISEDYMADLARINRWHFVKDITPFARIHSHVYFNAEYMYRLIPLLPPALRIERMFGWLPPYWRAELPTIKFRPFTLLGNMIRSRLADKNADLFSHYKKLPEYGRQVEQKLAAGLGDDLSKLDDRALWARLEADDEMGRAHFRFIRWGLASHLMPTKLVCAWITENWTTYDAFFDPEGHFLEMLLIDPAGNTTLQVNRELRRLGREAAQIPALMDLAEKGNGPPTLEAIRDLPGAADFARKLNAFITTHGHRGSSRELHLPRWMDDPGLVIAPILAFATAGKQAGEREKGPDNAFERRWLKEISQNAGGWWKKRIAKKALTLARAYTQYRENQRYVLDYILTDMRHVLLEIGARLTGRGLLQQADDIFFLYDAELKNIQQENAPPPEGLQRRRARFEADAGTLPPEWIIDDQPYPTPGDKGLAGTDTLLGTGASPGIVTGRARVILTVEELKSVRPGDILVAPNTDSGWTPVFGLISGLVVQTGGMLSHAAIVAREYGIPAVTGVVDACALITTGQATEVNGDNGRVKMLEAVKSRNIDRD